MCLIGVQSDVVGIFATHQHDLVDDRLQFLEQTQRVYCCCMEVQRENVPPSLGAAQQGGPVDTLAQDLPWFRPTFRVLPGSSCESLALQVALKEVLLCSTVLDT